MSLSLWLALLGASVLLSFTPGAGAINTMANALSSGWWRSIWGILGQQLALLVHVLIVAAGLGVLVVRTPWLFDTIRYVGAAYLVFLGVRQFFSRASDDDAVRVSGAAPEPAFSMFRRGVLVNLTNPKAIVFFLAFLPQFVRPELPLAGQYTAFVATVVTVDVLVMWFFFATTAHGLGRLTAGETGRRIVNRVFGSLFVGVGVLLAVMH
ncbi:LysE family transporter [Myceligenerans crystallogenes]|uniref:LysE family transporter n=1 Tax=Myceligenerans crystallogenes TaxID=316335 RepID=A0ABP4ZZL1_9MICO